MSQPQGALLVGSVNTTTAEETFRLTAKELSGKIKRYPDGEVGDRFHWVAFLPGLIAANSSDFVQVGENPIPVRHLDLRPIAFAEGADRETAHIPNLTYADSAIASYATFKQLQNEGVIDENVRFQVSLPTPLGVIGSVVVPQDRADFEPLFYVALENELQRILSAIPAEDLAIQWDAAVEFAFIESLTHEGILGGTSVPWWSEDIWEGLIERATRLAGKIPETVEVGFHLCYGDIAEKHFIEPTDTQNLVTFANALSEALPRTLNWLHLPVPIERDDSAYFEPLETLALPDVTEFYLGLVHREDGVEGAKRRISVAKQFVENFGIGTECGIGRAPTSETAGIFETHRLLSADW